MISTRRPSARAQPLCRARASRRRRGPSAARAAVAPSATSASRLDQRDLALEPVQAGRRLLLRRRLVDAALAAQLELEVLDRVGDVGVVARSSRARPGRGRAAGRPGRRRAARAGLPGRPAARRRTSAARASGLRRARPAWRARRSGIRGSARAPRAASAGRRRLAARGSAPAGRASAAAAAAACGACGSVGSRCDHAPRSFARACGRERVDQLRLGQVAPVACAASPSASSRSFSRAGLKMLLVVGEPERLAGIGRRRLVAARAGAERAARSPSQRTLRSGVRIAQRMAAKRRAKNGAVASTMWCSGSNQATCSGAASVALVERRGSARRRSSCACRGAPPAPSAAAATRSAIERVVAQRGLVLQAPEQAVEQPEAAAGRGAGRRSRRAAGRRPAR